jgi:hypothetical protein
MLGLGGRRGRHRKKGNKNSGTKPDDEGSDHLRVFHGSAIDSQVFSDAGMAYNAPSMWHCFGGRVQSRRRDSTSHKIAKR